MPVNRNIQKNHLFDEEEVRRTLEVLVPRGSIIEIRVLDGVLKGQNPNFTNTYSGYFDNSDCVITALHTLDSVLGIYVTMNPVNQELLSRSYNNLRKNINMTSDKDIVGRTRLLVDIDPLRASGTSATDAAKAKAKIVARDIFNHLKGTNWTTPICADSGNGVHMIFPINLPTNDGGKVQATLEALARQFDTPEVKIDTVVYNPARIVRLYGTRACKGDEIPHFGIYHRMSHIIRGVE